MLSLDLEVLYMLAKYTLLLQVEECKQLQESFSSKPLELDPLPRPSCDPQVHSHHIKMPSLKRMESVLDS